MHSQKSVRIWINTYSFKIYSFLSFRDVPKMKAAERKKQAEDRGAPEDEDGADGETLKQASRNSMYTMCVQNGLGESYV